MNSHARHLVYNFSYYPGTDSEKESFNSTTVFHPVIDMECKLYPGDDYGTWVWVDQGTERTNIPKCAVGQLKTLRFPWP